MPIAWKKLSQVSTKSQNRNGVIFNVYLVDFAKRLKDEDNMGRSQTFTIGKNRSIVFLYQDTYCFVLLGECKEEIEDEFWNYLSPSGEIPTHEEKKDIKPAIHLFR